MTFSVLHKVLRRKEAGKMTFTHEDHTGIFICEYPSAVGDSEIKLKRNLWLKIEVQSHLSECVI